MNNHRLLAGLLAAALLGGRGVRRLTLLLITDSPHVWTETGMQGILYVMRWDMAEIAKFALS